MNKIINTVLVLFVFFLPYISNTALAQEDLKNKQIDFFYSETCTHCADEEVFLDNLKSEYPELVINRYEVTQGNNAELLKDFTERTGSEKYLGLVPMTFINNSYVVGFNDSETTGLKIRNLLMGIGTSIDSESTCDESGDEVCVVDSAEQGSTTQYNILDGASNLNKFGIDPKNLSLPVLAVLLGFLDGFNICSLGALMLILSLVFTLNSRKKTFLLGGLFLIITGITYAFLIIFWTKIFGLLSNFVHSLEIVIGIIGLAGFVYFINQFIKFRKHGPNCEMTTNKYINNITRKLQETFKNSKNIWMLILMVILFSFIVTIIEFPCSAVIPVAFSAILSEASVSGFMYFVYLMLFMLFYLLDELFIFLFALWTKKLWSGSVKMTNSLVLIQALIFGALAVFYLGRLLF